MGRKVRRALVRHMKRGGMVRAWNTKARNYMRGGSVTGSLGMTQGQLRGDSVRALLTPGEIVIPVKHARRVSSYLRSKNIKLPGV